MSTLSIAGFAASELTLARPEAPRVARRALTASEGGPSPPADTHINASFAAAVQRNSEAEARLGGLI
jgi:hypothetical protein